MQIQDIFCPTLVAIHLFPTCLVAPLVGIEASFLSDLSSQPTFCNQASHLEKAPSQHEHVDSGRAGARVQLLAISHLVAECFAALRPPETKGGLKRKEETYNKKKGVYVI